MLGDLKQNHNIKLTLRYISVNSICHAGHGWQARGKEMNRRKLTWIILITGWMWLLWSAGDSCHRSDDRLTCDQLVPDTTGLIPYTDAWCVAVYGPDTTRIH